MKSPDIEYASLEDQKLFQEQQLRLALDYLAANSPFYQRVFKQYNIDVNNIKTIEDLQRIPFTEKKDLQLYNEDFVCVPIDTEPSHKA